MKQHVRAFTLIELSIVVVIIGLIVAGVVAGQSLVRQAQIRAVISDVSKYTTAWNTFKMQYNAMPGDYNRGSITWTGGQNGDGNGHQEATEMMYVWQHLSLAGIIPGNYTGAGGTVAVVGENVPEAAISGGCYSTEPCITGYFWCSTTNVNGTIINISRPISGGHCYNPILTTAEAKNYDTKMDDGVSSTGIVRARQDGGNAACESSSDYDLSLTTLICSLVQKFDRY